ncbi:MAG: ATP-dependent helicase HrpB [Planctomycetales bacterium]|nr:ATP-dependent helicase HrpB [Planctomycetales bacterium]
MYSTELAIDKHLAEIKRSLADANCLLLEAPPGTGKTTRVAPALLAMNHPTAAGQWQATGKVLLVQPRRIAARAAAARIANENQCELGAEVGFQVRFERRVSGSTRLFCMTPGILLRRLQADPILEDVSAILLDEFHERSLEYDLLLGMLHGVQSQLRSDLKLIIMSATLDADDIEQYLPNALRVSVSDVNYPVAIHYSKFRDTHTRPSQQRKHASPSAKIVELTAEAIRQAMSRHEGDLLAFLPGAGEIHRVQDALAVDAGKNDWQVMPLYGEMRSEQQDQVLAPCFKRKVVLATNIAETSLTIAGVRIVVDSGWARVQRIDPSLGLNRLLLEPISQASATQRAGRAGREGPGVCYRLWDEITARSRAKHLDPEVLRVDLSGAALTLYCWGEGNLEEFNWVTRPLPNALESAVRTLDAIGAAHSSKPTALGRQLVGLPVHPRLGRLLLAGQENRVLRASAIAAAILSERDVIPREQARIRPTAPHHCDLTRRVLLVDPSLDWQSATNRGREILHMPAIRQVQNVTEQLLRLVGSSEQSDVMPIDEPLRRSLLVAFGDRLARRRTSGSERGLMVGGRGIKLAASSGVTQAELFLCLQLDASGTEATVQMASEVDDSWLSGLSLRTLDETFYNPTLAAIVTRRRTYWFDLLLSETPIETVTDEHTARVLASAAAEQFLRLLPPKNKLLHSWIKRVTWLSMATPDAELPSFRSQELVQHLENWCYGMRKLEEVKQLPWASLLPSLLDPYQRQLLEEQAPEYVSLPSGRKVLLDYEPGKPPVLAARIQEFFGWRAAPKLAGGRIPLLLHLLAPNGRCQQITDDLHSFWVNTYPSVRKELRGRYPKHSWPEDPLA